jgi:hypothetical protein
MRFLRGNRGKTAKPVQILVSGVKYEVILTPKELDSLITSWTDALASNHGDKKSRTVTFELAEGGKKSVCMIDLRQIALINMMQ